MCRQFTINLLTSHVFPRQKLCFYRQKFVKVEECHTPQVTPFPLLAMPLRTGDSAWLQENMYFYKF